MEVSHLCVCINSTLNFAIYSLRGEKFKAAWREAYLGWCRRGGAARSGLNGAAAAANGLSRSNCGGGDVSTCKTGGGMGASRQGEDTEC